MRKVLFVCTANVCRSPMAEALFNALAAEAHLPHEAESAGVAALVDRPISPNAQAALEEVGVYSDGHRARQVDETLLGEADLVLAMTPQHAAALRRLSDPPSGRVWTLLGYANDAPDSEGVPDPHGHPMTAHRASVRQLFLSISVVVDRLRREG